MIQKFRLSSLLGLTLAAIFLIGCAKEEKSAGTANGGASTVAEKKEQKHDGWWCDQHGIPEAECSMCSAKVAKECKAKGDWCQEHQRAKSQCFLCDPSLREKYAARYRAKFGKEPPPPEDNMPKKNEKEKEEASTARVSIQQLAGAIRAKRAIATTRKLVGR